MTTYTFIIPHRNNPGLLNRCLGSIPVRDDVQIIVVDDNSREESQPDVRRGDVEVIRIDKEHTKGAGHARNVGMQRAKGKWLLFADCDDYYTDGFIDVLDRYKDEDIDVLYYNFNVVDGKNGRRQDDWKLQRAISGYDGTEEMKDCVRYLNNQPWTKMVSREFVERNNIRFEEVRNGNDVLFALMTGIRCRRMAVCQERLYNYVITPGSIGTRRQSLEDILCRFTHYVKHNRVNEALGHKEWNDGLLRFIYYELLVREPLIRKLYLAAAILIKYPGIWLVRNEWVKMIFA